MGITSLLDGRSGVSSRQLVTNMIRAALLAHEQEGSIRFEIEDAKSRGLHASDSLVVVPTGKSVEWPPATLEARLVLDRRASVADIVFDWLGEDSRDPWDRAAEQGMIMLVLRGVAVVGPRWRGRNYIFEGDARGLLSQTSPQAAEVLLARCRESRPDVWSRLDAGIAEAVRRRTRETEGDRPTASDPDPWQSEAAADRERFMERPHVIRATGKWGVLLALVGVGLAFLLAWTARANDLGEFTAVAAGVITLLCGLPALRLKPLRGIERRYSAWIASRSGLPSQPEQPPASLGDSLLGLVFLVPLLTFFVLLIALVIKAKPVLWLGLIGAILFAVYRLLQMLAGERIDRMVTSDSGQSAPRPNAKSFAEPLPAPRVLATAPMPPEPDTNAAAVTALRKPVEAERPVDGWTRDPEPSLGNDPGQVLLETIAPDAIPPATKSSRARVAAIPQRARAIRSVYRKAIAFLATSTTLLAVAYWLAGPTALFFSDQGVQFSELTPWFVAGSFLATLALLSPRAAPWLRGLRNAALLSAILPGRASIPVTPQETAEATVSIRPVALRLLGSCWITIALFRAAIYYPSIAPPLPLLFIPAALLSVLGYLYWINRGAAAVERQYPYQPPLNLLALRVFGSPDLGNFLNLSNAWQWIGTRQRLDGPDTAGQKAKDLFNYLAGRIDRSIVEDATELREALDAFTMRPDRLLRFPVNSIQCTNATWKEALQRLLDQADVVVMDLSSLSERNLGMPMNLKSLSTRFR